MKKIDLTSDRVRLPSNTAWFPTQLDRALTKLKFPFPLASTMHTDWAGKIFPQFSGAENRITKLFCRNLKNGKRRGAVERTDDSTMLTGH